MIKLENINSKNIWKVLKLHVSKEQDDFVASNTQSICEAYLSISVNGHALPFGIFDDETPVGAYNILRKYCAVSGTVIIMPVSGLSNPEVIKAAV